MIAATTSLPALDSAALLLRPVLVVPDLSLPALVGIALPLFIVTMASQNIPGIAVLSANGYAPVPGLLFATTGVFSLLRSEEHTSELQSLMRTSYAVFCLKKKTNKI